jgi:hypothetical protein
LRPVRGHRVDVGDILKTFFEGSESLGLDAVVIGKQNDHGRILAKKRCMNKRTARFVSHLSLCPALRLI